MNHRFLTIKIIKELGLGLTRLGLGIRLLSTVDTSSIYYSFVISCDRVDYIFSTVHKFKGLECDSVSLLLTLGLCNPRAQ